MSHEFYWKMLAYSNLQLRWGDMMKKLYLLIFIASMAFLLAGCHPKEIEIEKEEEDTTICVGDEWPCVGLECDEEDSFVIILGEEKIARKGLEMVRKRAEQGGVPKEDRRVTLEKDTV